LAWRLLRLGRLLSSTAPVLVAAAGEVLGLLFEGRLFLGLVVDRTAEGWGRHAQRGGQLGQGQLGGSKMTAAFLDVVDGR
jgi:alkanesulfonate monooxygenase SsuD/methylene tetrahydromethanopterin reductase-like flavin-dependent oxidoreductase (luciferase family)